MNKHEGEFARISENSNIQDEFTKKFAEIS
jgi:hypothetical protein